MVEPLVVTLQPRKLRSACFAASHKAASSSTRVNAAPLAFRRRPVVHRRLAPL